MSIEHHPQTRALFGQKTSRLPLPQVNLILREMAAVADLICPARCSLLACLQTMLSMLTDPALSDVCLVVEGIDVPCHKAVLGESVCLHEVCRPAILLSPLSVLSLPFLFFATAIVVYVYFMACFYCCNPNETK